MPDICPLSSDHPLRVQLRRTKGWRLPPNTVSVARPHRWGNPYRIGEAAHDPITLRRVYVYNAFWAVDLFRTWLEFSSKAEPLRAALNELRGKNLACWCRLCPGHKDGRALGIACAACAPCHADVVLKLANSPAVRSAERVGG